MEDLREVLKGLNRAALERVAAYAAALLRDQEGISADQLQNGHNPTDGGGAPG